MIPAALDRPWLMVALLAAPLLWIRRPHLVVTAAPWSWDDDWAGPGAAWVDAAARVTLVGAWVALVVAAAGPRVRQPGALAPESRVAVMVVLDVSRSSPKGVPAVSKPTS